MPDTTAGRLSCINLATLPLKFVAVYLTALGLLTIPVVQRHAIFLHAVRWPLFPEFNNPVKYGLPAHRSLNVKVQTSDHIELGAWLLLPPGTQQAFDGPPTGAIVNQSLSSRPTILLFHGNAATRAVYFRVQHCASYAARYDANVLAIDYRGYGDSEGVPSEEGLVIDARAAWDWVSAHGAKAADILLVGMSLGTGVAASLAAQLAEEDLRPRGVVLLAPFTSMKAVLTDYHFFGFIPVLQPLNPFPAVQKLLTKSLQTHFDTESKLHTINAPIMLTHSLNDAEIPCSHSQSLFNKLLEPYLPPLIPPPTSLTEINSFDWEASKLALEDRRAQRDAIVSTRTIANFGTVTQFMRGSDWYGPREVVHVEGMWGGHDRIGIQETVIDLIDSVFFPTMR